MGNQLLSWAVVVLPFLFAIGIEVIDEDIRKRSKKYRVGVILFGIGISALTWFQMTQSDKAHGIEQSELRNKLDQSLLQQQYTKGQLDSISLMVGKCGQGQSTDLSLAIRQMAQATASRKSDLEASNAELCKLAHAKAEDIRGFQGKYESDRQVLQEQDWEKQRVAPTDEARRELWHNNMQRDLTSEQTHERDFRRNYMADAKYLRDLLIARLPPTTADLLRGNNGQAEANLESSILSGAFNEYGIASYLDELANAVCPLTDEQKKAKSVTYQTILSRLKGFESQGKQLDQRCMQSSKNPPSETDVNDWANNTNAYVRSTSLPNDIKDQFIRSDALDNAQSIGKAHGCEFLALKIIGKNSKIWGLENYLQRGLAQGAGPAAL